MSDLFVIETLPAGTVKGAFLFLHGMESHSGWFSPILPLITDAGYAAIAFDRPGWGQSSGERGRLDSYKEVLETVSRFATELRNRFDLVHLAGMSWGGMAAMYCALRRPWLFDSLSLITPGLAAQTDLPFTAKILVAGGVLREKYSTTVPTAFTPAHFTGDPERLEYIRTDPLRVRRVSAGFCLETLKMRRFIKQTAGKRRLPPAQCLLAGNDQIIDNHAVSLLCQRAGISVQTFSNCRHTLIFEKPDATAQALLQQAGQTAFAPPTGTVWIAGAGAVGGVVGSLLSFGGVHTGMLVKEKYQAALRENGLTLESGQGSRNAGKQLAFASSPDELAPDPDLLIIAVKSFDTDAVLAGLSGKVPARTVIASLQNGIGNEEKIATAFPENTIVAGSICASVEMPGVGRVLWPDDRGGLAGALYRGSPELARPVWRSLLGRTGMECAWVEGEKAAARLKWSKLMLNIGFNALNSLTGFTSGEIMADPVLGKLVVAALREGFACMDQMGLQPVDLPGFPVSKLGFLLLFPEAIARRAMTWQAKRSAEAAFSMRQDVLKNRQHTEISELNGIIVRTGQKLNISTPANAGLVAMVEKSRK